MIQIKKGDKPSVLSNPSTLNAIAKDKTDYDTTPKDYHGCDRDGTKPKKKFSISDTYKHASVKNELIKNQYYKCCYCESKFGHNYHGDVEHYRPKRAWKQKKNDKLQYPGYYWLAYDWDNLLLSCSICNGNKDNIFPLQDNCLRATNHHKTIESTDNTLLINPMLENPEEHIGFREDVAYGKTHKGRITINTVKLDRVLLCEDRRRYLTILKFHESWAKIDLSQLDTNTINQILMELKCNEFFLEDMIQTAKNFVAAAKQDNSEYTAMTRAYLTKTNT